MKENVLDLIAEQFGVDKSELEEETSFANDLNADSIQLMELIMSIEEEFNIEIDEEDIMSIETIGDVIDYIENL